MSIKKQAKAIGLFFAQVGTDTDGIVGAGYFISQPYYAEDWSGKGRDIHYMDMEFDFLQDIDATKNITAEELEKVCPEINWHGGQAGVEIEADVAERLEIFLANKLLQIPEDDDENEDTESTNTSFVFNVFPGKKDVIINAINALCPKLKAQIFSQQFCKCARCGQSVENAKIEDKTLDYNKEDVNENTLIQDILYPIV